MPAGFEFLPRGAVLKKATPGFIAVDVGGRCMPGVIDHHFARSPSGCATSLVCQRPELVTEYVKANPDMGEWVIRMHVEPDFDSMAAAYLARYLMVYGELPGFAGLLAKYALAVDSAAIPPDIQHQCPLVALYDAACVVANAAMPAGVAVQHRYARWVTRGFELLDACAMAWQQRGVFWLDGPLAGWEQEVSYLEADAARYTQDILRAYAFRVSLPDAQGSFRTVKAIRCADPQSLLFVARAQLAQHELVHVVRSDDWIRPSKETTRTRHFLSVSEDSGLNLKGLGALLEAEELLVRTDAGTFGSGEPRWPDLASPDPWYDGRSPIHGYRVVRAPNRGTALSVDRVHQLLSNSQEWHRWAMTRNRRLCPDGCVYEETEGARYCCLHGHDLVPEVLGGTYQIMEFLGEGGMGRVCRAINITESPERQYAVKLIYYHDGERKSRDNPALTGALLVEEARALMLLSHPGVVSYVEVRSDPSEGVFLVSEYLHGCDLESDLASYTMAKQPYPLAKAWSVLRKICESLAYVHRQHVIHRDLKPSNIFLLNHTPGADEAPEHLKLIDFGIAGVYPPRLAWEQLARVFGTQPYAPPEHWESGDLSPLSDIYSLGIIMFQLLGGELPFSSGTDALFKKGKPTHSLGTLRPELAGSSLETLVGRMMDLSPSRRPASVDTVLAELDLGFRKLKIGQ